MIRLKNSGLRKAKAGGSGGAGIFGEVINRTQLFKDKEKCFNVLVLKIKKGRSPF